MKVKHLFIICGAVKSLFCIVLRLKFCRFKAFNFYSMKVYQNCITAVFMAVSVALCRCQVSAVGLHLQKPFYYPGTGQQMYSHIDLILTLFRTINPTITPIPIYLIPLTPHFIIFTLIDSKNKANRRQRSGGYSKHTKS